MRKLLSPEERTFSRNKWIYSACGLGRDMAYSLFSNYILTYILFTREVSTAQFAALGVILTVCRIWDGANDPLIGGLIENTRSRFGKFKPWIFAGALTNMIVLIVMFTMRTQGWAFIAWFAVLYLLWDITFTMNDIGYWSMLPSLTSDPARRDSVTSMANLFAGIGAIITIGFVPMLTNGQMAIGGNSITAYAVVAVVIAVIFCICQIVVCVGVKRQKADVYSGEKTGFKKMLGVIFHNDQLLWVTLIMLLYNLGSALLTAFGVNYMYLCFGYNGFYVTLFTAFYAAASVTVNAVYALLAKRFTRRQMSAAAIITVVAGYLAFGATGSLLPLSVATLCAEAFVIGFGQTLIYMIITIYLINTIEYNEYKTGSRDEAIIFSLRPFMAKMGSALQQVILTVVYIAIGMTGITNGIAEIENRASLGLVDEAAKAASVQAVLGTASPSMASSLRMYMVILPIAFISGAYLFMRLKLRLNEDDYKRMLRAIEDRKRSAGDIKEE